MNLRSSAGFAGAIRLLGEVRRGPSRPLPMIGWGAKPPSEEETL
jgi:hypothetical protein